MVGVNIQEGSGPLVDELPFSVEEYERRLEVVRRRMSELELEAMISFAPENLNYLTGHDTPGYYYLQACVITHACRPINVIRRIESTNTLGRTWSRLVVPYDDVEDPVEAVLGLIDELGLAGKRIGGEASAWFVTPVRYEALRRGVEARGGSLIDGSGIVEQLRLVKSEPEIAYMRHAALVMRSGMVAAVEASREGATENDVAAAAHFALVGLGSEYSGIPPIISSGPRTSLVHSTWSGRVLRRGDVLTYELPGVIHRYCVPLYRTGTVGPPTEELRNGASFLIEVLDGLIDAIEPGATSNDVHQVSVRAYERHGLDVPPKRSAYSVGVNYPPDWGEGHTMSITAGDHRPLEPGMVFHVGHGLFELGRYQIAITDTVLVTETGAEVLTDFPRELFVAPTASQPAATPA